MGTAPPPDAPSPDDQDAASVDAGFAAGPPVASLCGFALPSFIPKLSIGIPIPSINFPPPLPKFSLSLGLNCDVNNPLDVAGGIGWGGGRKASFDRNPDVSEAA